MKPPGRDGALLHMEGAAIRVLLKAHRLTFEDVLVDTGSEMTWLPAYGVPSLRLSGEGVGRCRPIHGGNFTQRYGDGSVVSGVRCETELQIGRFRFPQVIGAATSIVESEQLREGGLSIARGLLALSPAPASSFAALVHALPRGHRRLALCATRRRLVVGGGCNSWGGDNRAAHDSRPAHRVDARERYWRLAGSAVQLVTHPSPRIWHRAWSATRRLHPSGVLASVHLDSGCSKVVAQASHAPQLMLGVRLAASLALTLQANMVCRHVL
ncbi:hypothetical protein AB1Y20_012601 [Prymnesium parvum]|uniref:Peptidase A2 domain-containing protein n=1 Tax=Prymnesium parvum TaxID=97485 RepID=A0AB34IKA4_PRYPA